MALTVLYGREGPAWPPSVWPRPYAPPEVPATGASRGPTKGAPIGP